MNGWFSRNLLMQHAEISRTLVGAEQKHRSFLIRPQLFQK